MWLTNDACTIHLYNNVKPWFWCFTAHNWNAPHSGSAPYFRDATIIWWVWFSVLIGKDQSVFVMRWHNQIHWRKIDSMQPFEFFFKLCKNHFLVMTLTEQLSGGGGHFALCPRSKGAPKHRRPLIYWYKIA